MSEPQQKTQPKIGEAPRKFPLAPPGWQFVDGPWVYLMEKGWKPLGRPESEKFTRWRNPRKPLKDTEEKKVKEAPHLSVREIDGKLVNVWENKPVMVKDRNGQTVPCQQVWFTPAGRLYTLDEAIACQSVYDEEEAQAAAEREAKAIAG